MTGFLGMDADAVRLLAKQLELKATEIDTIATTLTSQIDGTSWLGRDADTFRSDWAGSYRTQLAAVSNALRDASSRATVNAAQQEEASRA